MKALLLACAVGLSAASSATDEGELVFVTALWRHGDRSPKAVFPNDPKNPASSWPQGLAQLTPRGMAQHAELGRLLKQRYEDFLPSVYDPNQVYLRSTDSNRTLVSALSNAAGMFRGSDRPQRPNSVPQGDGWPQGYLPVPVHTLLEKHDPLKVRGLWPVSRTAYL